MSELTHSNESQMTAEQVFQAGINFLTRFKVEADPVTEPGEFLNSLQQLDPRFNGPRKKVRYELEQDTTAWEPEDVELIMQTAEDMRMLEPETPLTGNHAAVYILAGARQSNLERAESAANAIDSGEATAEHFVFTGKRRPLKRDELEDVTNYVPEAATKTDLTEEHLMIGAARTIEQRHPNIHPEVFVVDDLRAGTPDVLDYAMHSMQEAGTLPVGSSVAAVTTQIYQTSTALDLQRVARRYGITETSVAGSPSSPGIVSKRTPATYMTEIIRTLRAATLAVQPETQA